MSRKALQRKQYDVALTVEGQLQQHTIEVTPADQLRAETEGRRFNVTASETPIAFTAVTIWRALVRLGLYGGGYHQLVEHDLYEWEYVDRDEEAEAVDPTHSADSTPSASPSPATSEEDPPSGSTPTSTSSS